MILRAAGAGLLFAAFTALSLAIGATIAGFRAKDNGDDFWEGFTDYITNNWAQSMAISSVLFVAMMGIGAAAKAAVAKAGSGKPLASAAQPERVFWSGGGVGGPAETAARRLAEKTGRTTLEMTMAGKKVVNWKKASKIFAKNAAKTQKEAYVFIHQAKYRGMESVWASIEEPILRRAGVEIITRFV
jgi:hypothetical protein